MAFDDDDDDVTKTPKATQSTEDAQETAEEALEDEAQDYRMFAALQRKNISSQAIRKGEKDFESHGTRSQASALEASRRAFEDVLGYTRLHRADRDYVRGWYFPERWAAAGEEGEEAERDGVDDEKQLKIAREKAAGRSEIHARDRTVCSSFQHRSLGRNIKGQGTQVPGWDKVWFLPEEALFLIERGTMDLWWPTASIDEIFPVKAPGETDAEFVARGPERREAEDEYALGVPLSLQAAYSLLVGGEGERGKVTLRNLQVFSNLNRAGFSMSRVAPPESIPPPAPFEDQTSQPPLWQRLLALLLPNGGPARPPACGPLVRPGLYRSYDPIYRQLALIPRHRPAARPPAHPSATAGSHLRVQYLVWKPGAAAWSKTRPPAPDYHLAVVDARETAVPEGEELAALLASVPHAPPPPAPARGHVVHARLKHGHRSVLVAVVDHGVTNYMRFAEGAFGEELLYKNFDLGNRPRGGKRGGGKFSRGGRGGSAGGRGRGGGRGGRGGRVG